MHMKMTNPISGKRHTGTQSSLLARPSIHSRGFDQFTNDVSVAMAADARWLKLKLLWQNMSREKQGRALGLLFIIAVAFIWVCPQSSHPFTEH